MAGSEEEEGRLERLAKEAEQEKRSLEKDADELDERIDETRGEWTRMRRDENVTGAARLDDDDAEGGGTNTADEGPG
jgi:hypothetical protein